MTADLLGPASDHAVTTRPARSNTRGPTDTWFQDCSSSTAEDGTEYAADFFNDTLAQFRAAFRGMGIVLDNGDDMLLRAIQSAGLRYGTDTSTSNSHIIVNLTPASVSATPGLAFLVKVNGMCLGPVDISVDGRPAKPLRLPANQDLGLFDLESGQDIFIVYDALTDTYRMLSPIAHAVIDTPLSFVIDPSSSGNFADLTAVNRWASKRIVSGAGSVTLTWPAGTRTLSTLHVFDHPNSDKFSFVGAPATSLPAGSALAAAGSSSTTRAANAATNLATLSAAFATKFNLAAGAGFQFKNFRGSISNVMFIGNTVGLGLAIIGGFGWSLTNVAACGCAQDGFTFQGGRGTSNGLYSVGNAAHGVEVDAAWLTYQGTFACVNNAVHGVTGVFGGYTTADTSIPGRPDLNGNGNCGAFFDKVSGALLTGGAGGAAKNNGLDGMAGIRCRLNGPVMTVSGNARYGASFFEASGDISNCAFSGNGVLDVFASNGSVPTLTGSAYSTTSPAVNTTGNNLSLIVA